MPEPAPVEATASRRDLSVDDAVDVLLGSGEPLVGLFLSDPAFGHRFGDALLDPCQQGRAEFVYGHAVGLGYLGKGRALLECFEQFGSLDAKQLGQVGEATEPAQSVVAGAALPSFEDGVDPFRDSLLDVGELSLEERAAAGLAASVDDIPLDLGEEEGGEGVT